MRATTVCCIGAIILVAACQDNTNEPGTTDTGTGTAATGTALPPGAGMETASPVADAPAAAQDFVNKLAGSNLYEIEAAKLARAKSKSDQVRTFAASMIDEHGKAQSQLETAVTAAANGLRFEPRLDADQQSQIDALRNAGADFDSIYVRQQRTAHEQTLALVRGYAESGAVQALREHAQKASEVVTKHLQMANDLPLT